MVSFALCDVLSTWSGDLVRLRGETRNPSKAEIRGLLPSVSFLLKTTEYLKMVLIVEEARQNKNKKGQRLLLVFFAMISHYATEAHEPTRYIPRHHKYEEEDPMVYVGRGAAVDS